MVVEIVAMISTTKLLLTIVTLTAAMLDTIWQDTDFQYSALYRSYLPKLAVETAGVEPGSKQMHSILEERDAAVIAWRGWLRKSAVVIMLSSIVFLYTIVRGKESTVLLALRVTALALGCSGSWVLFHNNVNWRRLKYTFSSIEGIMWMCYVFIHACAGLSRPSASVSSVLATVYNAFGFFLWLFLEAVQHITRLMHMTITCVVLLTIVVTIYVTAYVWQDDVVLADLNGVGVPGILTLYAIQRTCFINMLLLMAGSLVTVVKKNLSDNSYFIFISGNVLRREILEVDAHPGGPRSSGLLFGSLLKIAVAAD